MKSLLVLALVLLPQLVFSQTDVSGNQSGAWTPAGSPCIDAGTDYIVLGGVTLVDLEVGEYCGAAPDMGAYEFCPVSGVETARCPCSR